MKKYLTAFAQMTRERQLSTLANLLHIQQLVLTIGCLSRGYIGVVW